MYADTVSTNDNEDDDGLIIPDYAQHALSIDAAIARVALNDIMKPSHWTRLRVGQGFIVLIEANTKDWADAMAECLRRELPQIRVDTPAEPIGSRTPRDSYKLSRREAVARGQNLVVVTCGGPDGVAKEVPAAANLHLQQRPFSALLLKRAIKLLDGHMVHGFKDAEVLGLDFGDLVYALREPRHGSEISLRLKRANIHFKKNRPDMETVPDLETLPLNPHLRDWSNDLLCDLKAVVSGTSPSGGLSHAILSGPPGTGKTLLAHAIAKKSGWAFFKTSASAWLAATDGHLGSVASAATRFFDDLLTNAPSIGLIDELQSLPNRAELDSRSREWWTLVVDLVLTQIDRVQLSGKPVLLLGACNFFERLDAALIRPGRFGRRIEVRPPETVDELRDLLIYLVGADLSPNDLEKPARLAVGKTPAAIAELVSSARAAARREARTLQVSDLVSAMAPSDTRTDEETKAVALHECGHATVALALGREIRSITCIPEALSGGRTIVETTAAATSLEHVEDLVTIALAGRAADEILGSGANTGSYVDLLTATDLLWRAHSDWGLKGQLAAFEPGDDRARAQLADRSTLLLVEDDLARLLARAKSIVKDQELVIRDLAQHLVDARVLLGAEVAEIIKLHCLAAVTQSAQEDPPSLSEHDRLTT